MAKTKTDKPDHKWPWQRALEYLGGERDTPPTRLLPGPPSIVWGVWWGVLLFLVIALSGQSSRFIYIDF